MEAELWEQAYAKHFSKIEERLLNGSKKLDPLVGTQWLSRAKRLRKQASQANGPRLEKWWKSCPLTATSSSSTALEHQPRGTDDSSGRSRRSSPRSPRTHRSSAALLQGRLLGRLQPARPPLRHNLHLL